MEIDRLKNFTGQVAQIRAQTGPTIPIEVWFQDR